MIHIQANFGGSITINPIGKAFKVYLDGEGDSLDTMYILVMNMLRRNQ